MATVLETSLLNLNPTPALTAGQRIEVLRQMAGGRYDFTDPWFILTGGCAVFMLIVLLAAYYRLRVGRIRESARNFNDNCTRLGLSLHQRKVLSEITRQSGLKETGQIFYRLDSFERGASVFLKEALTAGGRKRGVLEEMPVEQLSTVIDVLKAKLGFAAGTEAGADNLGRKHLTSRQFETGWVVQITPHNRVRRGSIAAEIVENGQHRFTLRTDVPVLAKKGDVWDISYQLDDGTWQFSCGVVSAEGEDIVFNHSGSARYINRRRFSRVAVDVPAMMASFPAIREISPAEAFAPEFVNASVTDISGGGLRIETDFELSVGQRILVVFEMEANRLAEQTAVVRWVHRKGFKYITGVEMTGLNEANINHLVKAAGERALLRAKGATRTAERVPMEMTNG